jgi:hypothetical protein
MDEDKEDPGEAEEKNESIEDEEVGQRGALLLFLRSIKPEDLREDNKWDGAITGIEQNGKEQPHQDQVSSLKGLEMFDKEVEASHPEEHQQRVGASVLGEADVVSHEG